MKYLKNIMILCMPMLILSAGVNLHAQDNVVIPLEQILKTTNETSNEASFSYELIPITSNAPMPTENTIVLQGTSKETFGPIVYPRNGEFEYKIKLVNSPTTDGYILDETVYTVYVAAYGTSRFVTIEDESHMKVTSALYHQEYSVKATTLEDMPDIPLHSELSNIHNTETIFTYKLSQVPSSRRDVAENSEFPPKVVTIQGSGMTSFGSWIYTQEGTYHYEVKQIDMELSDYKYDLSTYTVIDTVNNVNGKLKIERLVLNEFNKSVDTFLFINEYVGNRIQIPEKPGPGPYTGDSHSLVKEFFMMIISAVIGGITFICLKKSKKEDALFVVK